MNYNSNMVTKDDHIPIKQKTPQVLGQQKQRPHSSFKAQT